MRNCDLKKLVRNLRFIYKSISISKNFIYEKVPLFNGRQSVYENVLEES